MPKPGRLNTSDPKQINNVTWRLVHRKPDVVMEQRLARGSRRAESAAIYFAGSRAPIPQAAESTGTPRGKVLAVPNWRRSRGSMLEIVPIDLLISVVSGGVTGGH